MNPVGYNFTQHQLQLQQQLQQNKAIRKGVYNIKGIEDFQNSNNQTLKKVRQSSSALELRNAEQSFIKATLDNFDSYCENLVALRREKFIGIQASNDYFSEVLTKISKYDNKNKLNQDQIHVIIKNCANVFTNFENIILKNIAFFNKYLNNISPIDNLQFAKFINANNNISSCTEINVISLERPQAYSYEEVSDDEIEQETTKKRAAEEMLISGSQSKKRKTD